MDANWRREAIVEILRQRGKVTTKVLAEQLKVSRQTIAQDITVLSLHYDICSDRGRNGGIYLINTRRPKRQYLSPAQVEVLHEILPSLSEEKRLVVQSILKDFCS